MFKYKRIVLYTCTFLYLIFSFVELIKYMFVNSNIYGLIYLLINLVIIFLLVPTTHNYKKYFSKIRISKLILIILIGIFNSFILESVVLNNIGVVDDSSKYIQSIFIYKSVFKVIIYAVLLVITILEFKVEKLIKSIRKNNSWLMLFLCYNSWR